MDWRVRPVACRACALAEEPARGSYVGVRPFRVRGAATSPLCGSGTVADNVVLRRPDAMKRASGEGVSEEASTHVGRPSSDMCKLSLMKEGMSTSLGRCVRSK